MHCLYRYFELRGSGFLHNANTRQPQHTALYALRLCSSSLHFFYENTIRNCMSHWSYSDVAWNHCIPLYTNTPIHSASWRTKLAVSHCPCHSWSICNNTLSQTFLSWVKLYRRQRLLTFGACGMEPFVCWFITICSATASSKYRSYLQIFIQHSECYKPDHSQWKQHVK